MAKVEHRSKDSPLDRRHYVLSSGWKTVTLFDLGLLVCLIIFGVVLRCFKTDLIIILHYKVWSALKNIDFGLIIGATVLLIVQGYRLLKLRSSLKKDAHSKSAEMTWKLNTPEEIYDRVESFLTEASFYANVANPGHEQTLKKQALESVRDQLDQMNELQENLEAILKSSDKVSGFASSEELLQEIENTICGNVKNLLNYLLVSTEDFLSATPETIRQNQKFLDEAKDILRMIVDFINGGDAEAEAIIMQINAFRKSIQMFADMKGVELDEKIDITDDLGSINRQPDGVRR